MFSDLFEGTRKSCCQSDQHLDCFNDWTGETSERWARVHIYKLSGACRYHPELNGAEIIPNISGGF